MEKLSKIRDGLFQMVMIVIFATCFMAGLFLFGFCTYSGYRTASNLFGGEQAICYPLKSHPGPSAPLR